MARTGAVSYTHLDVYKRQEYTLTVPTVARKQESKLDGTIKYLWELSDGNCIETVLMS